jgi:ribose transport system permease protein
MGPFLGLALVVFTFAILTGEPARYLSPFNVRIVLAQTVVVAISAIGMTMIIVGGGIDLSVGAAIALTSVVTALGLHAGWSPWAAATVAILVGALVGVVNGLVVTRLRVVPFIATLGMLGIARGVAKWLANEQTVNVRQTWLNNLVVTFPKPPWLLLAPGVWLTVALAILGALVLRNTVYGRVAVRAFRRDADVALASG